MTYPDAEAGPRARGRRFSTSSRIFSGDVGFAAVAAVRVPHQSLRCIARSSHRLIRPVASFKDRSRRCSSHPASRAAVERPIGSRMSAARSFELTVSTHKRHSSGNLKVFYHAPRPMVFSGLPIPCARWQVWSKKLHLWHAHVTRMPHTSGAAMPTNEKAYPVQVGLLGTEAIVPVTNTLPDLVQQSCGAQNRCAGFHGILYLCFCAVHRSLTQVAAQFQEEAVPRISRLVQLIS